MPIPTLEKTWNFDVNNQVTASGNDETDNKEMLFIIHAAVTSLGSNPWVIDYMCDGSTAGTEGDNVDRWASASDISWGVGAAAARSWVVYTRPGGDQVLFDQQTNSASYAGPRMVRKWSPGGLFTGGSVTAAPTATDEVSIGLNSHAWSTAFNTSQNSVVHVLHSDDGEMTMFIINYNNVTTQFMLFCDLADPVTGMNNPRFVLMDDNVAASEWPTMLNIADTQNYVWSAKNDDTVFKGTLTTEYFIGTILGETINQNDFSGEYHLSPVRFASNATGAKGSHGRVPDLWFGALSLATGDNYPSGATYQLAQFGDLVVPWSGAAPITA